MKVLHLVFMATILLISCKDDTAKWRAIGLFEQDEVVVSASGCGTLLSLNAIEGQRLFKDSIIGVIDTTLLGIKKAELIADRDTAMNLRTEITKKISDIEKQISWQRTEKVRLENLVSLNSATKKQVEDVNNNILSLEKNILAEQKLLEKANTELIDKSIIFGQQISQVEENINKCLIASPIDGFLQIRHSKVGDQMSIGKPIFSVANTNNIFLKAYITAEAQQQIYREQEVTVVSNTETGVSREHKGTITWISEISEPTPKNIKKEGKLDDISYTIKVLIRNDGSIKKGTYGEVKFKGISISKQAN